MTSSSPLYPTSNASWRSLIDDLADVQAFIHGPENDEDRETPGFPATDIELETLETELRFNLPEEYRDFLRTAGGWQFMFEQTHALSPADLLDGPLHRRALQVLSEQDDIVLARHNIKLQDLLPIAVSATGLDLMCLIVRGPKAGAVLWTIGAWDALYPSVRAWLEALIEDSRNLINEVWDGPNPFAA